MPTINAAQPMTTKVCGISRRSQRRYDVREIMMKPNGKMMEKGYVDCDEAAHQLAEKNSPQGMDAVRLRSVGKAFRHEGD